MITSGVGSILGSPRHWWHRIQSIWFSFTTKTGTYLSIAWIKEYIHCRMPASWNNWELWLLYSVVQAQKLQTVQVLLLAWTEWQNCHLCNSRYFFCWFGESQRVAGRKFSSWYDVSTWNWCNGSCEDLRRSGVNGCWGLETRHMLLLLHRHMSVVQQGHPWPLFNKIQNWGSPMHS